MKKIVASLMAVLFWIGISGVVSNVNVASAATAACSMTIYSNKNTSMDTAAQASGVCNGLEFGYYVQSSNQFNVVGISTHGVSYSGQKFTFYPPTAPAGVTMTVYTVKKTTSSGSTSGSTSTSSGSTSSGSTSSGSTSTSSGSTSSGSTSSGSTSQTSTSTPTKTSSGSTSQTSSSTPTKTTSSSGSTKTTSSTSNSGSKTSSHSSKSTKTSSPTSGTSGSHYSTSTNIMGTSSGNSSETIALKTSDASSKKETEDKSSTGSQSENSPFKKDDNEITKDSKDKSNDSNVKDQVTSDNIDGLVSNDPDRDGLSTDKVASTDNKIKGEQINPNPHSTLKLWIGIILIVIVLGAIGGILYWRRRVGKI